ncbi:hypothetical protein [Roseovarius sp. M141]|uniref:hypothetical protein n=1 Tax=Roseovarius sp. M141 TaxID=2583806 RepID=UPI0020CF613E|nr:hypothetical protein [Roseovarius sp. M141]MCQ0093129.1 hypothetical protein [Roseovarius sp. M141]
MLLRISIIALVQWAIVAPAWAASCRTSLNGTLHQIDYTVSQRDLSGTGQYILKKEMKGNTSVRERLFGRWGKVDCPAYLTLREFTPGLTDAERKPFCLVYDKDADTYTGFSEGDRNAYLICNNPKTFCERVNATKDEARSYAQTGLDMAMNTAQSALSPDVGEIISHSSGALIMKGSGSFISGVLGTSGTSIGAALTAPAVVAAGAVTLVGVGGAVYFCR